MAAAGRLTRRLGIDGCLVLILGCYTLRFAGYATLSSAWAVLPFQLLHGITFGLYWTVGTTYAALCAPAGLEATLQGAFTALISAGQALALIGGGFLFDAFGGAKLYAGAASSAAAVTLVALALAAAAGLPRDARARASVPLTPATPCHASRDEVGTSVSMDVGPGDCVLPARTLRSDERGYVA